MIYMVIKEPKLWAGRWPLDLENEPLIRREWGWVKKFSGYMPLTVREGVEGGDAELFAVYAIIALVRAGTIQREDVPMAFDRFMDLPFDTALMDSDDETGDGDAAVPPTVSSNESGDISGPDGSRSSAISESLPNGDGTPASESSESGLLRSAT